MNDPIPIQHCVFNNLNILGGKLMRYTKLDSKTLFVLLLLNALEKAVPLIVFILFLFIFEWAYL